MDETPKSKDGEEDAMLAVRTRLQPSMLESVDVSALASVMADRLVLRKASLAAICDGEFIIVWASASEAWRHQRNVYHSTRFGAAPRRAKHRHDLRYVRTRPIEGVVQQF